MNQSSWTSLEARANYILTGFVSTLNSAVCLKDDEIKLHHGEGSQISS